MSIKNGLRKSISLFIVIIMLLGSTPMSGFAELEWPAFKAQAANDAASEELILDTGNKITRAQWLHNLAVTFDMSVEDEAYPDNYFSDLESTHQYYYDVLLNVNFGVIDIEAGANVEPDGLLTRSFASQTLNYCLGFQLENANYTFSDYASCDDPDDAQIAVNRGWFSLVDGKFCPENFVTDAEVGEMMTDAKSVLDSRVVDENYESAYTFDTSVVEIPDGTEVSVDENIVEITACSKQIKSGSKFAIYQNGIPKIYEAVSVSTSGAITTVTVNPDFDGSSLFLSIDAQGVADASEFDIVPDDDTTITVDEIEQAQSQSSARKKAKGTVNLKKIYNFDKSIDFGDGISIKCNISMENPKVEYTLSTNPIKARVVFIGNATVNFNGNFDLTKAINLNEIPIGEIGIPGIGGLKLCVDLSLAGSVGASTSGNLRFGFNYSSAGFSIERNFNSKSFYLTASANASAGLSAKFGIDTPIAEAGVFFKIGGKAAIDSKVYTDGKKPMECANFSAFLYCSFGMKAAIKLLSFKEEYNNTQVVWDMKTSPIKIARHYEDGKEVSSCLRGSAIGYFTPWNSIYGSTGWSEGFGSTGYDRTGKPFAIYEYEVKKDEHENEYAVITKYSGNATSLYIPQTLDGYTIKEIGNGVFKNKLFRAVVIPDTVVKIDSEAFRNCRYLSNVVLSKSLESLGAYAFGECDSLVSIEIPKSLKQTTSGYIDGWRYGVFSDSNNLKNVTFEEGTTIIANHLFRCNNGIEKIVIPDTVTSIGEGAFEECESLSEVVLSNSLETIGSYAFKKTPLHEIKIPDSVKEIRDQAFRLCNNLSSVTLSRSLETIGAYAFGECDSLVSIKIPKSLKQTTSGYIDGWRYGVFSDSNNLKNVTFEEGTTIIANHLFRCNNGIEKIVIPDTVTSIGEGAFEECRSLNEVVLSNSLETVGSYAFKKTPLHEIKIPDSVKEIRDQAFRLCNKLSSVTLSRSLETIGAYAFGECDSLVSIEIPKSLKQTTTGYIDGWRYGVFSDSNNLKNVTFEEGTTIIANHLFKCNNGIEKIVIPDTVTSIGEGAFEECGSLNEVVLSNSLETIGSYAFKKTPLHEIKIPDSVKEIRDQAFRLCNNLSSVTLSKSLEALGAYAFGECDSLVSIEIPKSLKRTTTGYIDGWRYGVFSDSNNLKNVTFEEGTTIIANHLFKCNNGIEKIVIPDTVTFIKDAAFQSCTNLKEVILPNHLEKTEGSIFDGCSSLENISIPDSVTSIGDSLFRNCTSLTNVELLCRIDKIPKNMFQNCTSLESITIPETVNKIYPEAFRNCDSLESIEIPDAVTGIDNWAFAESDNLKTVKLNSSLDFIGNNAFRDCDALETIKIPNSVTTVSDNCFYDCDNLKNVELSLSLKEIKYGVFEHCDSLESIVIPQLVGKICDNAFKNCVKLAKITIPKSTTEISTSAFSYKDRLTIFGVSGSPAETFAKDNDYKFVAKETPVESVVIPEKLTMNNGSKVRLVPTITPIDFTDDVVWKTGNKNVVTVDETGLLKAVSSGTAKVKLCIGDITATCEVTVFQPVTAIYLNSSMSLEAGETKNVNARVNPSNATNKELAYASSDSSIASVDENGNVTAHKKGKAVITVTALDGNGAKGTCEVTVLNTYYDVTDIDSFESSHNYPNNCSDIWSYTKPGAGSINVTFDERTYVEEGFDYIKIYDANNNEVGTYTGDELAGKTITITGNTVKIKLISDDGGTDWGFKVVGVYSDSTCTDHVFEDTVVEPTCTTSGYTIHTCSVCGYNYKDVTPSLGHNIIIDVEAKDATCTENGTTEGVHCSRCDYRIEAVAIKAKGHTEKVMPAVSASCSRTGLTEGKKCSVCGKILVAQTVIERTEHSYEVVVVDPTCTTDGYTTHKCSVCGYSYTDNAISAFGHTDEDNDGECDRCGETIDESVDPSDPDNPIQNCKCACHKTGIAKFFFKIGLFFQKLFKKNQICKCGVWHY